MKASINGLRMHYHDRGSKGAPCLLLVHGFPLDARMWTAQLDAFAPEARVIAPDLRGHGRSEVPPGPFTMEQHADDLVALLDHVGVEQATIAGLSMGAYVAFAMWRRHPSRVRALVLLDTRPDADAPAARENRNKAIVRVQEVGSRVYAEEMLPKLMAPVNLADSGLKRAALAIMGSQPEAGIVGALEGLRDRQDSRSTLATIDVPTLVVVGEEDALTPPAEARMMAQAIRGAEVVVVPRAGHLSPLENPRAVNRAMRRFMRGEASMPGLLRTE